mmetsp:Transcript_16261/g.39270  ORF Transcript_16261/g.39270 Transcript_16261/m.39270 type:complete len:287 (-) Transcript_16261:351-1211(-)
MMQPGVARIRVWVATPAGGREALEVVAGERVERLRDKVGGMKSLAEASGAWTISGVWSPKLMAMGKPLVDGESLLASGVVDGTLVEPVYASAAYEIVHIPEIPNIPGLEAGREKVEKAARDARVGFSQWIKGGLRCLAAGVGLDVQQDARLCLHVVQLAPAGPAEEEGSIRVGDVIQSVNGRSCIATHGLSDTQVSEVRRVGEMRWAEREEQGARWTLPGWGPEDHQHQALVLLQELREELQGLPGTEVQVCFVRGGGLQGSGDAKQVLRATLKRKGMPHLAGSYM